MKKTLIAPGLAALALLAACGSGTTPPAGDTSMSSSPAAMMERSSEPAMMASSAATVTSSSAAMMQSSAAATTGEARVIEVSMSNWAFAPKTISVKKGENVVLRVKGVEGIHSFAVPGLNINVAANPGESKDITIPTDTAGTFDFRCFIPCGSGHKDMVGQLVIS